MNYESEGNAHGVHQYTDFSSRVSEFVTTMYLRVNKTNVANATGINVDSLGTADEAVFRDETVP